jgi:hypothetical protein
MIKKSPFILSKKTLLGKRLMDICKKIAKNKTKCVNARRSSKNRIKAKREILLLYEENISLKIA